MHKYIITLSCKDVLGIVSSVSNFLFNQGGFILESSQFGDSSTGEFFMRVLFQVDKNYNNICKDFESLANKFNMKWVIKDLSCKTRVLIMVSKLDHCLNYLLHRWVSGALDIDIPVVISNHEEVSGIANWYNIPFKYLPVLSKNRSLQEDKVIKIINEEKIDLLVLARYMQILSPKLSSFVRGRAINIHHSFLPSFKGAKPYHQAYDKGVKIIGATAHYITEDLDEGPIIDQEVKRVSHADTPNDLLSIGRDLECQVLYRSVKYHVENRVVLNGNKTVVFT